jgi:hypothetical protein
MLFVKVSPVVKKSAHEVVEIKILCLLNFFVAMLEKYVGVSSLSALRARHKVYIRFRA